MKPPKPAAPIPAALAIPVVFKVRAHTLSIAYVSEGRWTVSVDGGPASQNLGSRVEAWEAGVRAADQLDRQES